MNRGFLGIPTLVWVGILLGLILGMFLPLHALTLIDNLNSHGSAINK